MAMLAIVEPEACEPDAARTIENQIVGAVERLAVARVVECREVARAQVDALDRAAAIDGRRPRRQVRVARLPLPCTAVVTDIDRAVRADRRAVRSASELRDRRAPPV